jgi:phage/plasmid-associated DNA primase
MIYVPFDFQIGKEDPTVEAGLLEELPQILGVILAAGHGYYRAGKNKMAFPPCERITSATAEYLHEQDNLRQFLENCTVKTGDSAGISPKEIYKAYAEWYLENVGNKPIGKKLFFGELKKHKLFSNHTKKGDMYQGIRLLMDIEKGIG